MGCTQTWIKHMNASTDTKMQMLTYKDAKDAKML